MILSIVLLVVNLILGLLGWSLKEHLKTLVTHEVCQKCRAACADVRSPSTASAARLESKMENVAQRQEQMDRKLDNIISQFARLPMEYVTLERFRDALRDHE